MDLIDRARSSQTICVFRPLRVRRGWSTPPNITTMLSSLRALSKSLVNPSRSLSTSIPSHFAAPSLSRLSEAKEPASPPLTDGERGLKVKIEAVLNGAIVEVQDVSGKAACLAESRREADKQL